MAEIIGLIVKTPKAEKPIEKEDEEKKTSSKTAKKSKSKKDED